MGGRILIVDDDADFRQELAELLAEASFEVVAVPNVSAACEEMVRARFDLVTSDFRLQGGRGWIGLAALQAAAAPTPVGIISGWPLSTEEVERRGLAFLIKKPFDLERELLPVLAKYATVSRDRAD